VSLLSAALMIVLLARRLIVGSEAEGLFTLFAIMFFFIGLALFGIGLLGEYVGRIYTQVRERPRYVVEAVLEDTEREVLSPQDIERQPLLQQDIEPDAPVQPLPQSGAGARQ